MIPIVFAANAVSPQMMCTIPRTAATWVMISIWIWRQWRRRWRWWRWTTSFDISNDYRDDLCRIRLAERHPRFFVHRIHVHVNHTGSITPTFGHSFCVHSFYSAKDIKDNFGLLRMALCVTTKILMLFDARPDLVTHLCSCFQTGRTGSKQQHLGRDWRVSCCLDRLPCSCLLVGTASRLACLAQKKIAYKQLSWGGTGVSCCLDRPRLPCPCLPCCLCGQTTGSF